MPTPIRPAQGKSKKIDIVKELTDKLSRAKALVIADYQGLTHKQLEELRKLLKKTEAEFKISKNNLLKKALEEVHKPLSASHLQGATATLFAYADEVSPIKTLVTFFKNAAHGSVRAGVLGANELTASDIEKLSVLPSREILLAQLVGQLRSPIYGLHNALSWNLKKLVWTIEAVKTKKADTAVSS